MYFARLRAAKPQVSTPFATASSLRFRASNSSLRGVWTRRSSAVHVLTADGHDGPKYVLTGPESITHAELVGIIGEAIGEEVRWQDLPPETAREQLIAAWGNAAFVDARLNACGLARARYRHRRAPGRPAGAHLPLVGRGARRRLPVGATAVARQISLPSLATCSLGSRSLRS